MHFEDLVEGAEFRTGSHRLTAQELREFAQTYDPQPMHLDAEQAGASRFGGIIASGFQTMALAWRLWVDNGMGSHGRGGIAVTDARWYRPVYADTDLRAVVRIVHTRLTTRGDGLATMHFDVYDGMDRRVLEFATTGLFARRNADA